MEVNFYKDISKSGYFKKFLKSQNKDAVAKEIGCIDKKIFEVDNKHIRLQK